MDVEDNLSHIYLNDEVINNYMDLITLRSPDTIYAFNTFFYQALSDQGYEHVNRWTKKIDIFSKKKLFIPIHVKKNFHWCLVCVEFQEKSIKYYDSLGVPNFNCMKLILKYLMYEYLEKKGKEFQPYGWILANMKNCPKQHNVSDCGVFVCMYAEHLSRNAPLKFTQKDMPMFRKQIMLEIKKKQLKIKN